jgi:hypothetical protein
MSEDLFTHDHEIERKIENFSNEITLFKTNNFFIYISVTSGLYYQHIMIISDDSIMTLQGHVL